MRGGGRASASVNVVTRAAIAVPISGGWVSGRPTPIHALLFIASRQYVLRSFPLLLLFFVTHSHAQTEEKKYDDRVESSRREESKFGSTRQSN